MIALWSSFLLISSVLIGGGIVVFLQKLNQNNIIKFLLSLSGGFLLAIAFIHFIPEMYEHGAEGIGYYILLGFLIQLFLEYFSGGIEHGHVHIHDTKGSVPWSLFIALSIHSFIEGMPLNTEVLNDAVGAFSPAGHEHHYGDKFGVQGLLLGIVLHNIPVAIALMTLLLASGFKKAKAWFIMSVFAIMGPLGMFAGKLSSQKEWFNTDIILAIVVGMFLHISTTIIFEANENHKFNFIKLISLLIGVGLAIMII